MGCCKEHWGRGAAQHVGSGASEWKAAQGCRVWSWSSLLLLLLEMFPLPVLFILGCNVQQPQSQPGFWKRRWNKHWFSLPGAADTVTSHFRGPQKDFGSF